MKISPKLDVAVYFHPQTGEPWLDIRTNLPEMTQITAAVSRGKHIRYADGGEVHAGRAYVEGIFGGGDGIPMALKDENGIFVPCDLAVATLFPLYQPYSVQKIIGDMGENLSGPYITTNPRGERTVLAFYSLEAVPGTIPAVIKAKPCEYYQHSDFADGEDFLPYPVRLPKKAK